MKKKSILFIVCLMATVFSKAQTDTVTIFYPGFTNQCCSANSTPYFCFNDPVTCSTPCGCNTSTNTQTFMNTVPAGKVVTKVSVYYYTMNCGGAAASILNGLALTTAPVDSGSCLCSSLSSAWSITASSSNVYPCGIPGYNYGTGATETFFVNFIGEVCISQAKIVLTYTNTPTGTTPTVTINASQDTVCSGTTVTLTASGANTYTWSTGASTNSIAVSPVNSNTYTVIGTDITGACINMATQAIYVEGININATQGFICGGPSSVTLTASGANTYTWNTSATTNNIVVTPSVTTTYSVAGTGTMTGCTSLSAITTITVSPNPAPITSFTLTQDTAPHTWDAYAGYPSDITNASWSWGDGTSTIGLYPSHIYATPGSYNVCVTVTVTTGCSATYCQSDSVYRLANNSVYSNMVYVNVLHHNQATGIKQFTNSNGRVNIYPNPNNGNFIIETNSTAKQTIQIYDVTGKLVLSQTINGKTNIDASSLNEGVYNISIQNSDFRINKRLVIVR